MYNNNAYSHQLSVLEEIRKAIGNKEENHLNLAQIVVIGDQSSGKSSLMHILTGIPFPAKSGITTKCPTIVYTKHIENDTTYKINEILIPFEDLENKITQEQTKILKGGLSWPVDTINVSETPIEIYAEGPKMNDIVLVDLPGIIANGPGKVEVTNMINKYIGQEETLILIVTEGKQDDETAGALELARDVDPDKKRTIRILSKCDFFDSDESKERAILLVNNNSENEYGPHAIISQYGGKDYDLDKETNELKKLEINKYRAGIATLKKRLPKLLAKLIRTNLPNLKIQINSKLKESKNTLEVIGYEEPNASDILYNVSDHLKIHICDLEHKVSDYIYKFYEKLRETKEIITDELIELNYKPNAFKSYFFQGEDAYNNCMSEIINKWISIIDELLNSIRTEINISVNKKQLTKYSNNLSKHIVSSWNELVIHIMSKLEQEINKELSKEREFKTLNHYLTSKYQEKLILPEDLLEEIVSSMTIDMFKKTIDVRKNGCMTKIDVTQSLYDIKAELSKHIEIQVDNHNELFNKLPLNEQHKRRIKAAVIANWSVAYKNFGDNVLSSIKNIVITNINNYITRLPTNTDIKSFAIEKTETREKRKKMKEVIETMVTCGDMLDTI